MSEPHKHSVSNSIKLYSEGYDMSSWPNWTAAPPNNILTPVMNPLNQTGNHQPHAHIPKQEIKEESHICHWLSCSKPFESIDILVEHIHKDHLEKDGKRELICLWDGCSRSKKPFKVGSPVGYVYL